MTAIKALLIFLPVVCFGQTGGSQVFYRIKDAAGAILRSVEARLSETPFATDFGADTSGSKDSSAAFSACVNSGLHCFLPSGSYKTMSVFSLQKSNFVFECASPATTITYAGPPVASPFLIGNGITEIGSVRIINCDFEGGQIPTVATITNNVSDNVIYQGVRAGGGPIGLLLLTTVVADINNFIYSDVPGGVGIEIHASNQITIRSPNIARLNPGGTAIIVGGLTGGSTAGTRIVGGTGEAVDIAVRLRPLSVQSEIDNFETEVHSSRYAVEVGGDQADIHHSYMLGGIHVLPTATNTAVHHNGATFSVTIDSGAKNTYLWKNSFDPIDDSPAQTLWMTDLGTNTRFWDNVLSQGNVPLEEWHGSQFLDFVGAGSTGCVNCVVDTGSNNALAGTFSCVLCTYTPQLVEGMTLKVYIKHTVASGTGRTLNFAGSGPINMTSHINPASGLISGYVDGSIEMFTYSFFNNAWLAMGQ